MEYDIGFCYWGLPRAIKHTYKNHENMVYNKMKEANLSYKIFMHTWSIEGDTQRVRQYNCKEKIDYDEYKLMNPDFYEINSQEEFLTNINMDDYFYKDIWTTKGHCGNGEWVEKLVKNHLCALGSLRNVYNMVENAVNEKGYKFKYIIFIRPDAYFTQPIQVDKTFPLKENTIVIPNFDHCEGYNDRFAICNYEDANIYALRLKDIAEFRKNKGRIVSEKYLKYTLNNSKLNIKKEGTITFKLTDPNGKKR